MVRKMARVHQKGGLGKIPIFHPSAGPRLAPKLDDWMTIYEQILFDCIH